MQELVSLPPLPFLRLQVYTLPGPQRPSVPTHLSGSPASTRADGRSHGGGPAFLGAGLWVPQEPAQGSHRTGPRRAFADPAVSGLVPSSTPRARPCPHSGWRAVSLVGGFKCPGKQSGMSRAGTPERPCGGPGARRVTACCALPGVPSAWWRAPACTHGCGCRAAFCIRGAGASVLRGACRRPNPGVACAEDGGTGRLQPGGHRRRVLCMRMGRTALPIAGLRAPPLTGTRLSLRRPVRPQRARGPGSPGHPIGGGSSSSSGPHRHPRPGRGREFCPAGQQPEP